MNRIRTSAAPFRLRRRSWNRPGSTSQGGDTGSNPVGTTRQSPRSQGKSRFDGSNAKGTGAARFRQIPPNQTQSGTGLPARRWNSAMTRRAVSVAHRAVSAFKCSATVGGGVAARRSSRSGSPSRPPRASRSACSRSSSGAASSWRPITRWQRSCHFGRNRAVDLKCGLSRLVTRRLALAATPVVGSS